MPTTIYDSSLVTKRRANKASSNSFITRVSPPNNTTGYAPMLGIYDNSIVNTVKLGSMVDYRKCGGSVLVNPGCPCAGSNSPSFVPPGAVTNIRWIVGSIILQWDAPADASTTPISYLVTPYYNGIALEPVTTTETHYRFTGLEEWKPYTFTVCAMNGNAIGPVVKTTESIIMPPTALSNIMEGSVGDIDQAMKYVLNDSIDKMLLYITKAGLGPTRGARVMYMWMFSVATAWQWITGQSILSGTHDNWDWTANKSANAPLTGNDCVVWMCSVMDYIMPIFVGNGSYKSIYNCDSSAVNRVKSVAQWAQWSALWNAWRNGRMDDGSVTASTTQPTSSANWDKTIVVDGTTVSDITNFPEPQAWTCLTVQGKKQGYLTWDWESVASTCLSAEQETVVRGLVSPAVGSARDAEIDTILSISATLTDEQKMIAEFWAGGPKTPAPPCMYVWLCKEYIRTLEGITCDKMIYSLLDLCVHLFEGSRVTWMLKKAFMESRPIQEIRRRYAGLDIQSWNGVVKGDQWIPYQEANFVTPPFADFPSGHSHFGRAFALTMNKWFGSTIQANTIVYDKLYIIAPMFGENQTNEFGTFTIPVGTSGVEPSLVPRQELTLSWNTWDDMAESSGVSRFYGGIHAVTAHVASKTVAETVDGYINSAWNFTVV